MSFLSHPTQPMPDLPPGSRGAYPPLDTLKPIAPRVFIVDSTLPASAGYALPVRMTVIILPDDTLLLHSPTRLTEPLRLALLQLGPVAHLVAPNFAHWTLLKPWQQGFPDAVTWPAPGLRQRRQVLRSGLRFGPDLAEAAPAAWGDVIDVVLIPGGIGFHEAALFHRPSRTLLLTDLVINLEPAKIPPLLRAIWRMLGCVAPSAMPPAYLRLIVRMHKSAAAAAVERMLRLQPERVVFAHGLWFQHDAMRQLRHSFRWLLDPDLKSDPE